jgi:hypothetical protein
MSPRLRSLVGSLAMLVFLAFYVWLATFIGAHLPDRPWVVLLYYGIVGTAWGLPLIPLLSWINKGHRPR